MNDLKTILKKYDLKPNKLLGQNFLVDRTVLEKIIGAADLSKKDTVLEVGPGLGILTEELAKHAALVIAVEKDKQMAEIVRDVLNNRNIKNIEIIEDDILKILNLKSKFLNHNYKVVANIPYYLTSHLIRKFLESENPPAEIILMVQKEVAQRICAKPPRMSLLAVSVQFYAQPKIMSFVSKKSFWPRPKVDSAIIKIAPRQIKKSPSPELFFRVVKAGFAQPRKQLAGNLSKGLKIDREKIAQTLKKIGLAPQQRAETLNVSDWIKLTEFLTNIIDLRC